MNPENTELTANPSLGTGFTESCFGVVSEMGAISFQELVDRFPKKAEENEAEESDEDADINIINEILGISPDVEEEGETTTDASVDFHQYINEMIQTGDGQFQDYMQNIMNSGALTNIMSNINITANDNAMDMIDKMVAGIMTPETMNTISDCMNIEKGSLNDMTQNLDMAAMIKHLMLSEQSASLINLAKQYIPTDPNLNPDIVYIGPPINRGTPLQRGPNQAESDDDMTIEQPD